MYFIKNIKTKRIRIIYRALLIMLCSISFCFWGCSNKGKVEDEFIPDIEPIVGPSLYEETSDTFKVFVEVNSKENYFFNMYDIEIKIDGYEIGTVSNGKLYTKMLYLNEGYHEISVCRVGKSKPTVNDYFNVDEDMTYICTISHSKTQIGFKSVQTKDDIEDAREEEIDDFTGVTYKIAKSSLKEKGFSDISMLDESDLSGKEKWIVVGQNISAGNSACIMDSIILECIPQGEYVAQYFKGKSVSDIIDWAEANELELCYKKYRNDKDLDISKYADFEKKEWKIINSIFDSKKGSITLMVSRGYDEIEDIAVEVVEVEEDNTEAEQTTTESNEPESQTLDQSQQNTEKQTTEQPKEEVIIPKSFDPEFYASHYPDVVAACGNSPEALYKHYLNYGKKEGRFQNAEEEAAKLAELQEQPQPEPNPIQQVEEQPQPTPQPSNPTPTGDNRICYITPKGKKWHLDKECAGKNAIQTTVGEAKQNPRIDGPCGTCAKYE